MKIKLHKHLDRKIWDKSGNMKSVVSDMLLSIAWAYIDYVRNEYDINIRNSDVADIFVFGSITQYFYDKQSDIDMCIVLNLDNAKQQFPNLDIQKTLKLYYYDWAMVHICRIYNRKIDLNIQDINTPEYNGRYRTGPIYSLIKQEWVFKPSNISKQELKNIEKEANILYKRMLNDYKTVKNNGFRSEDIKKLYGNIIKSKKQSVIDNPELIINPVYMAARNFKHKGYIKKLNRYSVKNATNKYVLK